MSFENITSHHFKTIVTLYLFVLSHICIIYLLIFVLYLFGGNLKNKIFFVIYKKNGGNYNIKSKKFNKKVGDPKPQNFHM